MAATSPAVADFGLYWNYLEADKADRSSGSSKNRARAYCRFTKSSDDCNIDQNLRTIALKAAAQDQTEEISKSLPSSSSVFSAGKKKSWSQPSLLSLTPSLWKTGEGPHSSEIKDLFLPPNPCFGVKEEAHCWMGKGQAFGAKMTSTCYTGIYDILLYVVTLS